MDVSAYREEIYDIFAGADGDVDVTARVERALDLFETEGPLETDEAVALYQSERYGDFSYAIPVPTGGDYEVTLRFAETCWQSSGQRVFDVEAEGQEVVTDLDLYAEVGRDAAYDVTRTVSVTDGTLNLTFTTDTDNATVSAIAIRPAP